MSPMKDSIRWKYPATFFLAFLSEGLALFYTHKMKLRFPEGIQTGLHFVIAPTRCMTKEDYEQAVKDLSWQLCTIKASAEMKELISHDDDLEGRRLSNERTILAYGNLAHAD
ncbi:11468_t:CDS:1, partial [Paraglomus brasilianum]